MKRDKFGNRIYKDFTIYDMRGNGDLFTGGWGYHADRYNRKSEKMEWCVHFPFGFEMTVTKTFHTIKAAMKAIDEYTISKYPNSVKFMKED